MLNYQRVSNFRPFQNWPPWVCGSPILRNPQLQSDVSCHAPQPGWFVGIQEVLKRKIAASVAKFLEIPRQGNLFFRHLIITHIYNMLLFVYTYMYVYIYTHTHFLISLSIIYIYTHTHVKSMDSNLLHIHIWHICRFTVMRLLKIISRDVSW